VLMVAADASETGRRTTEKGGSMKTLRGIKSTCWAVVIAALLLVVSGLAAHASTAYGTLNRQGYFWK
jgi:hypothetical protein